MNRPTPVDSLANVHTHMREGEIIGPLVKREIEGGADVLGLMPNTADGLKDSNSVLWYESVVQAAVPEGQRLQTIPHVMITEGTRSQDIMDCTGDGILDGKLYPRYRTTNSENGIVRYARILPVIQTCGTVKMKVHLHPEHPNMCFDSRDAEFAFLPIARMFLEETDATIIWEHGTDARCIPHWKDMMATSGRFFVTLTAHHLATNEDLAFGDVRSVCKPPIKTERDRQALIELVTEDHPWVMAGGDDAFHDVSKKHVDRERCACGAYTAPFLLPLYAHALDHLMKTELGIQTFINFTSRNARALHGLKDSTSQLNLAREPWQIPLFYYIDSQMAVPFWAGQTINWRIVRE